MLWGVKLYPLQHSRKRRFTPGMDAKEIDLNLFYLWKKNAAQFSSQWVLWHEGRGSREEKRERKGWNAEHQEKIHFLTSLSLLSKKTPIEMPNMCCPASMQEFSGPRVSSPPQCFAAASLTHLLLSGNFCSALTILETKGLPLSDLVCFLPKLLFCSSCHKDAPVRRMCLKRSMTS